METVTIPKAEYEKLKAKSQVNWELVEKVKKSLEAAAKGKIREIKPSPK